jgi:hypothetical protein
MMMQESAFISTIYWAAHTVLSAVFAVAGVAKLLDGERARAALHDFGVPERALRPAFGALVAGELLIAALLALPWTRQAGALAAFAALVLFTLQISAQLLRGKRPPCACFGALTPAAIGPLSIVRNLLLMALAAGLLIAPDAGSPPTLFAGIPIFTLLVLGWSGVVTCWLLLLTRQHGRLLLQLQQLERRHDTAAAESGQPRPTAAMEPPLRLIDAYERPFDLSALRGHPALLLFLDGACTHCRPLLARLRDPAPTDRTLVVISADVGLHMELAPSVRFLHDPDWSAIARFGLRGTPAGVLLDAAGVPAQPVVYGTAPLAALLTQRVHQEVPYEPAAV